MTPRHWSAIGIISLALVTGAAAGIAGDRLRSPRPTIRTQVTKDMSSVLDRLDLSAEQRARAESIIGRSTPRAESLMMEMSDRFRTIADSVDADLRRILDPAQRLALDSLRKSSAIMFKRKVVTPDGKTVVDTLLRLRRDSGPSR
jgi:hypothetical protein